MRSIVIYYSYTGHTHRIAQLIMGILRNKGEEVIPVRIRPLKEVKNFFMQCKEAFLAKKPKLYRTLLDLESFDKVIFGSPVWALKPAPAINTYLDNCGPLKAKTAICFVTYGSGVGKDKALGIMKNNLEKKGARVVKTMSFQESEALGECKKKLSENL